MRSVCYLEVLLTGRPDSGVLCTWVGLLILARLLVVLWRLWQPKDFPQAPTPSARPEVRQRIETEDQKARKICASMCAPTPKAYVTRGTDPAVLRGRVSRICLYFLKQMLHSSIYCEACYMFVLRKISRICCLSVYLFA
jgi:hypothetical protein